MFGGNLHTVCSGVRVHGDFDWTEDREGMSKLDKAKVILVVFNVLGDDAASGKRLLEEKYGDI